MLNYVVSIVGTGFAIYSYTHKEHKKMKYLVTETKDNKFMLYFWNASKKVITKEDLYELYIVHDCNSSMEVVENTDDIQISFSEKNKYIVKEIILKKRRLASIFYFRKRVA